ncbi:Nn.00g081590.m01.CDS01 [Neocucurbitaria sp. VM-36]
MPLTVSLITSPSDFDQIIPMDYDAWLTPYNPQLKHFRPVFPTREESIAYTKKRDIARFNANDPNNFMIKVTDEETDLMSLTVNPSHRHRGAGRRLIRWGIAKADELGIETVISSLPSARGAYEKSGLGAIEIIPPNPELKSRLEDLEMQGRGQKWRELLEDDLSGWLMWRPIGRDFKKGDKAPWVNSVAQE